ncbi:MAG: hypothetical protein ACP5UQ_09325 [Anaerolineae bacterium]
MKERLLILLATAALLIAALQPALPSASVRGAVATIVPYGDCQDDGTCQ